MSNTNKLDLDRFTDDFTLMLGNSLDKDPKHIKLFLETLSRLQKQEALALESTIKEKRLKAKG